MKKQETYQSLFESLLVFDMRKIRKFYPDSLFKFISFDGTNLDNLKFETLISKSIYFNRVENLNDPFEFIGLSATKEALDVKDELWIKTFNHLFDERKSRRMITCFTTSMEDNIAMWANYANNHKGFCCKYKIVSKKAKDLVHFTPVCYVEKPLFIDKKHLNIQLAQSIDYFPIKSIYERFNTFNYMYNNLLCSFKAPCWNYENEIRIFWLDDENVKGKNVSLDNINLELTDIYAGINCIHKIKLKKVCKSLGVNFHQMELCKNKYCLKTK